MQITSSPNPLTRWPFILASVTALAIAAAFAFFFVFSRPMSPDEGYLMITVQGFNSGHALYNDVFTQYGPFYYFYEWLLHSVLQIPLTHDATRLLCAFHWILAAALFGVAAWKMTRSTLAGLFVAMQSLVHLSSIAHEPGHPQELVAVLVAAGILVAARFKQSNRSLGILALIATLIAFTKINIGLFFGFALLLAVRCYSSDRFARGFWNWLLLAVSAALPFLLMRQHLAAEWCRNYALLVAGTTLTILFVAQREAEKRTIGIKRHLVMVAVFGVTAASLFIITLATGTSTHGLIDGLFLRPLKMASVALLPLLLSHASFISVLTSLATAALVLRKKNDSRVAMCVVLLKLLFALAGAFALLSEPRLQLGFLLPWVWLVALPVGANDKSVGFARVFLSIVAAWQSLQAYPIAGTQTTLAVFPLVLAYGVCLFDAMRALAQPTRVERHLANITSTTRRLVHGLACVALLFLFANTWCKLPEVRREYASLLPLDLPGSRFVRMDEEVTTMNQQLTHYLSTECDTFVSYPGINSLYFWTGKIPPTQINGTGWGQLTHAQQQHILDSLQQSRRPKLVVTEAMMKSWGTPYADPIRPLVRFVTEECRPIKRIGRCLIFEPKAAAPLSAKQ